jgi:hypothetical protein
MQSERHKLILFWGGPATVNCNLGEKRVGSPSHILALAKKRKVALLGTGATFLYFLLRADIST